jgi:hypothetical protein
MCAETSSDGSLGSGKEFLMPPSLMTSLTSAEQANAIINQFKSYPIPFHSLVNLSPEAAEVLAQHEYGIYFTKLQNLDLRTAQALSKHRHGLIFKSLAYVSEDVGNALAKHGGVKLFRSLVDIQSPALAIQENVDKTGLVTLSPSVAQALSDTQDEINLSSLKVLGLEAAKALCSNDSLEIFLPGLATGELRLESGVSSCLLKHKGLLTINLENLKEAGQRQLSELLLDKIFKDEIKSDLKYSESGFNEDWNLDGIDRISCNQLRTLCESTAHVICLRGLLHISPDLLAILPKSFDAEYANFLIDPVKIWSADIARVITAALEDGGSANGWIEELPIRLRAVEVVDEAMQIFNSLDAFEFPHLGNSNI